MIPISIKRLAEIETIPDDTIDFSDIPELDDTFWKKAKLVMNDHSSDTNDHSSNKTSRQLK